MLPSTGYFKAINCPFYESGSCERPYCHFKHAKREDATTVGGPAGTQEARAVNQARDGKVSTIAASDTDVLQQLVTEAVKKVLANREVADTDGFSENVVCRVVEGLKPSLTPGAVASGESTCATVVGKRIDVPIQISKPVPCVYNPTPIAELKKRHIPIVSYMPTRETRVAVKRKSSPDASKPWLGVVGESASTQVPEIRYKPTAIAAIDEGESSCNYVPTCKSDSAISSSYEDTNSGDYLLKLREEYYPKSKKRREEYIPKKVKAPLKTVGGLDETSLGQFESEFHVIDTILTTAHIEPRAVSCENSQDSCFELEPKFSDDEEVEHRNECGGPTDDNSEVENVAIDGNNGDRVGTDNVKDDNDDDDDDDVDDDDDDDGTNVDDDESTRPAIKGIKSIREEKAKVEGVCVEDKRVNRVDSKDETKRVVDDGYKSQRISSSRSPRRETTEGKVKTYSGERNRRSSNKIRSKDRSKSSGGKRSREDSKESQKRERDSNAEEKRRSGSHRRSRERSRSKKSDRALSDSHERKDTKRHKKERTVECKEDGEGKDNRKDRDKERNKERKRKERGNERESSKSKNSALSIKKGDCEKKKDRSREDRRRTSSRTTHKSNDESCRNLKLKKREKNDVIRKRSKRSVSPLESVRFVRDDNGNSVSGDEEDEEEDNYEYKGLTDNGNENDEADDDDDDLVLNLSDSDHDVHEECLKIFQEYQVPEQSRATLPTEWKPEVEEQEDVGRKRVAHPSAAANVTRHQGPNRLKAGKRSSNPQQKMYERWRLMREVAAEKAAEKAAAEEASGERKSSGIAEGQHAIRSIMLQDGRRCREMRGGSYAEGATTACNSEAQLNGNGNGNGNGRVRIAHVPYARSLAMEKRTVAENAGKTVEARTTDGSKTAAQTAKSGVRVAHVPQAVPQLIRPEPLQVNTQKFSLSARQYFVNMMHDVCVQIYTNAEDAAQRAVKEEFSCHERCKALPIYKNLCMLAAHRLRKEVDQVLPSEMVTASASACRGSAASGSGMVSHETVLAGKSKGSWSVLGTKRSVMEFKGAALYGMMKKWILTEQQLRDNGFPRPHPDGQKGRAKIYVTNSRNQNVLSKVPNERICGRCGQSYAIDRQGFAVRQENCIYHWGRKFTFRGESRYSCCRQDGFASGCCDAKTHVWDYTDYENLRGYVRTLPKVVTAPEKQGVYALDCEMSYTTQGLELTRVTVIDDDCNVVYEALVKPQNPIIDYNTRFSGITEETMKNVTTTLLDVQATLLTMFSDKTILVGHSLDSDFAALRLLHDTVVDTSVMFPHKNGYPQKRALKNLCSDYLRKIIQNDVGGHDSKEDAVACMELILWKAKEEAKLQ